MSTDYLPTITAFADAWESALALLWQRVNAFLAKHGSTARLPVGSVPIVLNLSGALGKLRVAARELRRFRDDVPEDFLRLFVGESPWTIPRAGEADYQLQRLADISDKAGIADPWKDNVVEPNIKHADAIRAWLATEKSQAITAATPTHSDDFTSVNWFGTPYTFAKGLQAEAVRVLWEARDNGTPRLSEKTIGDKIGSANDQFRLEHVFKPTNKRTRKREAHPAWGTMIKRAGKGIFALSPS